MGVIIDVSALLDKWGIWPGDGGYTLSEIEEMLVEDIAEKGLHTVEEQTELLRDLLYGLSYDLPDEQQPNFGDTMSSGINDITDLELKLKVLALQQERDNLKRDLESVRGILRTIAVSTENPPKLAHQLEYKLEIIHQYVSTTLKTLWSDQENDSPAQSDLIELRQELKRVRDQVLSLCGVVIDKALAAVQAKENEIIAKYLSDRTFLIKAGYEAEYPDNAFFQDGDRVKILYVIESIGFNVESRIDGWQCTIPFEFCDVPDALVEALK